VQADPWPAWWKARRLLGPGSGGDMKLPRWCCRAIMPRWPDGAAIAHFAAPPRIDLTWLNTFVPRKNLMTRTSRAEARVALMHGIGRSLPRLVFRLTAKVWHTKRHCPAVT